MKRAALATWGGRVAPVFDVARQIHLVEVEAGRVVRETQYVVPGDVPVQKALLLAELQVGTLLCGAISRLLLEMIEGQGIRVISFLAGGAG